MSAPRQRVKDWRTRLHRWAHHRVGTPFVWGKTDCAALAREALTEMFGMQVLPDLPVWRSLNEAARAKQSIGSMGEVLTQLGARRMEMAFMRAGDLIVQVEPDEPVGRESVMVCVDERRCVCSTREGVVWGSPEYGTVYSLWEVVAHG